MMPKKVLTILSAEFYIPRSIWGCDMNISAFDENLNYIDEIDKFTSLQWVRKYHETGTFELHCPVTSHNIKTLIRGNLIWKKGSKEVGIIEYRNLSINQAGEEQLKLVGRFYTSVLSRRILRTTENHQNKLVELIVRSMVDKNCITTVDVRKLPILLGTLNNFAEKINYQNTYGDLLEELTKLSLTSGVGFYIRTDLSAQKHYFETFKGIDRSINQGVNSPVVFSRDYDNFYEQEYTDSDNDLKTTAIVAGEGEGSERTVIEVLDNYTGLDRRELFVDARDLQKEVDGVVMTDTEYRNILTQRGNEKLSEYKELQTFEGKIITKNYEYKKDYDLGDIVTVLDKNWDVAVDTRITEITEIYENGKIEIVPVLGNKIPTVLDKLKRR